MRSLARSVFSLLFLLSWTASTYSQTQTKQELAEAAADKVIRRFYETLDFADIYREFYVDIASIRRTEVEIVMRNMLRYGDRWATREQLKSRNIEFAAMESAYIALGNFHWTMNAASLTYQGDNKNLEKECGAIWDKYLPRMEKKGSWPILTSVELEEKLTAGLNALANCFRGYVVTANLDTPEFRRRVEAIRESRPADPIQRLKELFAPAGMSAGDNIYIARRGRFYLYMIEEDGRFKMFSWNNRVMD